MRASCIYQMQALFIKFNVHIFLHLFLPPILKPIILGGRYNFHLFHVLVARSGIWLCENPQGCLLSSREHKWLSITTFWLTSEWEGCSVTLMFHPWTKAKQNTLQHNILGCLGFNYIPLVSIRDVSIRGYLWYIVDFMLHCLDYK